MDALTATSLLALLMLPLLEAGLLVAGLPSASPAALAAAAGPLAVLPFLPPRPEPWVVAALGLVGLGLTLWVHLLTARR